MILIPVEEMKILMNVRPGWCVSLFMPTHRSGEDTRQDPIRLKNLLGQAEERLIAKGMRTVDAKTLLEPARSLEGYSPFWRHLNDGLAMYLAQDVFRYHTLPMPLEEQLVVAEHFYIKPLLPLLSGDGLFYVLALSQNSVRLLQGTRYSVGEVDLEGVPSSLAELLEDVQRQKQMQLHPHRSGGAGNQQAAYFGHGDVKDQEKQDILHYFRQIDAGLRDLLKDEPAPLVLAGVDYLLPIYRSASSFPHLLTDGITGNPEQISSQELHARAWQIVEPHFQKEQQEALSRFGERSSAGQASLDIAQIVSAAYHGRVQDLFVALGEQYWGAFNIQTDGVESHPNAQPGGEDLLQFACNYTILNGGSVFAMEKEDMPAEGLLAATYRY